MKILFITTDENSNLHAIDRAQGDYCENLALIGLREILGDDCVDYPRKKILYGDFSSVPKHSLHGQGFSLYDKPMRDISDEARASSEFDVILYGTVMSWNMRSIPELEAKCKTKFYIDGNDLYGVAQNNKYINYNGEILIGNQMTPSFKRQIIEEHPEVYPIGISLPESRILPIDLTSKVQLFQRSYPRYAFFETPDEVNRKHHIYNYEQEYYSDLSKSWFGLSCKRGGWDAMRHCEIIAAGTLLLYRDYHLKPPYCAPVNLPTISYSNKSELLAIMEKLVVNNKPTTDYIDLLLAQRAWLTQTSTTLARANYMIKILKEFNA